MNKKPQLNWRLEREMIELSMEGTKLESLWEWEVDNKVSQFGKMEIGRHDITFKHHEFVNFFLVVLKF